LWKLTTLEHKCRAAQILLSKLRRRFRVIKRVATSEQLKFLMKRCRPKLDTPFARADRGRQPQRDCDCDTTKREYAERSGQYAAPLTIGDIRTEKIDARRNPYVG
jgi:hypothetical protein